MLFQMDIPGMFFAPIALLMKRPLVKVTVVSKSEVYYVKNIVNSCFVITSNQLHKNGNVVVN